MRRWSHIPRCIRMQESRLSTSTQYSQLRHRPKPISKPKNEPLKVVARPLKGPSHSIQPKRQHPSFWHDISALVATRWKSKKLPVKIAFIFVVLYLSGVEIVYLFCLDRVPITGRKRLSWTSESLLQELDDLDRQRVEEIRENKERGRVKIEGPIIEMINSGIDRLMKASGLESLLESLLRKLKERFGRLVEELGADKKNGSVEELGVDKEKGSMEVDGPALEMITSVLNRLVKASGLDEMAWEVRITNEPNVADAWISKSGLVVISSGYIDGIVVNEDELAAALGHEIAHIIAGHDLESYCIEKVDKHFHQPLLLPAITGFFFRPALVFSLPTVLSSYVSYVLSKIREREADYISLLLMTKAGFNSTGAVSLWKKYNGWEDEQWRQRRSKSKWYRRGKRFHSEHPYSASRIKDIEKFIPEIKSILDVGPTATNQPVRKPKLLAARQGRWQDFVEKRNESRQSN